MCAANGQSCGQDTAGTYNLEFTRAKKGTEAIEIMVTGLKGGHSGLDAHQQRGNAIRLLAQLLNRLEIPFQIAKISGGSLRNAIPREAEVVVLVKPENVNKLKKNAKDFVKDSLTELKTTDGGLTVKVRTVKDKNSKVITYCISNYSHTIDLLNIQSKSYRRPWNSDSKTRWARDLSQAPPCTDAGTGRATLAACGRLQA